MKYSLLLNLMIFYCLISASLVFADNPETNKTTAKVETVEFENGKTFSFMVKEVLDKKPELIGEVKALPILTWKLDSVKDFNAIMSVICTLKNSCGEEISGSTNGAIHVIDGLNAEYKFPREDSQDLVWLGFSTSYNIETVEEYENVIIIHVSYKLTDYVGSRREFWVVPHRNKPIYFDVKQIYDYEGIPFWG